MQRVSGPWDEPAVVRWLAEARIPVRLAVLGDRGPLVVSLWYAFDDGALWCATRSDADVVRHVSADPRVGFEVAPDIPPYRGVRGTGRASIVPDQGREVLDRLLARYLDTVNQPLATWLRDRADDEVAIRIDRLTVTSWDFSGRMQPQEPGPRLPDLGA
jgi:nitroimidazol reductase NimA-like FMN-containing flavoprotein (pyridoxamine 5'-phosphate oxidase superfamily)